MPIGLTPVTSTDDHRVPAEPPAPDQAPALLWPSVGEDGGSVASTHFPARHYIYRRRELCETSIMPLPSFVQAVAEAHRRVFIMDSHFDEVAVRSLQGALGSSLASDVRLLTGSVDDLERKRRDLEERMNLYRRGENVNVRWHATLDRRSYPFLHDRFAVVDGALWHFGATVGGGHPGLNAASGPWAAGQTRSVDFFEECWKDSRARVRVRRAG